MNFCVNARPDPYGAAPSPNKTYVPLERIGFSLFFALRVEP